MRRAMTNGSAACEQPADRGRTILGRAGSQMTLSHEQQQAGDSGYTVSGQVKMGAADRRPSISAVLPAFNEEACIERVIRDLATVLGRLTDDFETIVTNDGSYDRTGTVLATLQNQEPELHLRVVTHQNNCGYGAALASGFDAARKDLIFLTDSDQQFDITELSTFLPLMDKNTDMVIGWRRRRADPTVRLFNAWGWKLLVNGLFGYTARDVDCAYKLFRRLVWESVTVHARGATFSAEFLVKARRLGFQVKELPVTHLPRPAGNATGAKPRVIARAFSELFRLRRNLNRELYQDPRGQQAYRGQAHAR
jgi:glycosyltransferase involved in cell wall biosynthesis